MTDELTPEATSATPQVDESAVAAYLGVSVEELADVKENAKNADNLIKKAQREMTEAARLKNEQERLYKEAQAKAQGSTQQDEGGLDPASRKLLEKEVKGIVGGPLSRIDEITNELYASKAENFETKHPDINIEDCHNLFEEWGSNPQTPSEYSRLLEQAAKYIKKDKEIEAKLKTLKDDKAEVVEVKGKGSVHKETNETEDAPTSAQERWKAFLAKRKDQVIKYGNYYLRYVVNHC